MQDLWIIDRSYEHHHGKEPPQADSWCSAVASGIIVRSFSLAKAVGWTNLIGHVRTGLHGLNARSGRSPQPQTWDNFERGLKSEQQLESQPLS